MCVCVCVCVCVVCVCVCVCVCVRLCVAVCACVCPWLRVCGCVCVAACMWLCVAVSVRVCACLYLGCVGGRQLLPATSSAYLFTRVRYLETQGYAVTYLGVDSQGAVSVDAVLAAVRPDTWMVTLMHSNNEVGTLNPIALITRALRAAFPDQGILVHTDASQSVGKVPCLVRELGVDFLNVAGHKVRVGRCAIPAGVGFLVLGSGLGRGHCVLLRGHLHPLFVQLHTSSPCVPRVCMGVWGAACAHARDGVPCCPSLSPLPVSLPLVAPPPPHTPTPCGCL